MATTVAANIKPPLPANPPVNAKASELDNYFKGLRGQFSTATEAIQTGATELYTNVKQAVANIGSTGQYNQGQTGSVFTGLGRMTAYIIGIVIIILALSLFVHFFITPIYILQAGNPGIINVSKAFNDGVSFWNGTGKYPSTIRILDKDLPIFNMYADYSFIVDINIQKPNTFSNQPRVILSRGFVPSMFAGSTDSIPQIATNYNFIVALSSTTTDLIVSMRNKTGNAEDVKIDNIPIETQFRLGVVVMQKAFEVYINGKLLKTRKFATDLANVPGDIIPASGIISNVATMKNLTIWKRTINSHEMAQTTPSMA